MATESGFAWDISGVNSSGGISQYLIVMSTAADTYTVCTGSSQGGAAAKGICQNDPDTGQPVTVRKLGISKVVAGGTIAVGAQITSSTAGQALSAGTTGQFCFARANTASTASGQIIEVILNGGGWLYSALSTA